MSLAVQLTAFGLAQISWHTHWRSWLPDLISLLSRQLFCRRGRSARLVRSIIEAAVVRRSLPLSCSTRRCAQCQGLWHGPTQLLN